MPCFAYTAQELEVRTFKTQKLINSKNHSALTFCIFLIARGCVLFVWLVDWAGKLVPSERKTKNLF